jgi:hypothetical protein
MSGLAGLAVVAKARSIAGSIPRQVWIALAVLAVIAGGIWWHKHTVSNARKEGYAAGVKAEGDRIAAKAAKIAKDAEAISAKARSLNNETNRRIVSDARTVLLRGPGKASCLNPSTPGAGRRIAPAGKPDATRPQVPVGDGSALLAAVPWPWLVDRAEQCDLNRAEAETWRNWHRDLTETWKKTQ